MIKDIQDFKKLESFGLWPIIEIYVLFVILLKKKYDNGLEIDVHFFKEFIITWILHQFIMYSNKVKLETG